jgi:CBS domain-containing protein
MGEANEIRRAWWLRLLAEGTDLSQDFLNYIRLDQRRAKQLMHAPVVSATERASVSEVADLMAKHHIKRVPIVRDGKVIGVVSRADLIRLIAQTPDALIDPL